MVEDPCRVVVERINLPNGAKPGKIDYTELPWVGVTEVARVLQDPRGSTWREGSPDAILKSLLRHVIAVATQGIDAIDEDGKSHLAKVGARCLMLLEVRTCTTAKVANNTHTTTTAQDVGAHCQTK
jgi:hypothetical protein